MLTVKGLMQNYMPSLLLIVAPSEAIIQPPAQITNTSTHALHTCYFLIS